VPFVTFVDVIFFFLLLGAGLIGALFSQPTLLPDSIPLALLVFGVVGGGEVLERYLFYKVYARYGV